MTRTKKQIRIHAKNYFKAIKKAQSDGDIKRCEYLCLRKDFIASLKKEGLSDKLIARLEKQAGTSK